MSADLERSIELLTAEVRDLRRWLKEEQARRLTAIEEALMHGRRTDADHAKQLADMKIDVHDHGKRIRALEAGSKRKARR